MASGLSNGPLNQTMVCMTKLTFSIKTLIDLYSNSGCKKFSTIINVSFRGIQINSLFRNRESMQMNQALILD